MRHLTLGGVIVLTLGLLLTPPEALAQQQKSHRLGWLIGTLSASVPTQEAVAIFRQRCVNSDMSRVYWQTHESNATGRRLYDKVAGHFGFIVYARDL